MKWQETEFENIYLIPSKNGLTRPSGVRGTGYKFINMGEIFAHDRIGSINMERVQMNEKELNSMLVEEGDLLFARQSLVLAGAGKCSIIQEIDEPTTFESHIIRVRLRKDIVYPRFYYYYFKSPICKIKSIVTQGVQAGIRGNDLKKLKVHVPPLETQQKIADILSKYDDLIENNRRRIELLEESARLLYREWFVYLRFPGHEHTPIIDGIPEGWEKVKLSDLCLVGRGGSPRPIINFMDGTIPWFKIGDATQSGSPFIFSTAEKVTEDGAKKSVILEPFSLIVSNSATCGIPFFTGITGCIHDGWLHFANLNRISKWFLYCCLYSKQKEMLSGIGDGSTQKNLNTKYVGMLNITLPKSHQLLSTFDDFVKPIFNQIFTIAKYNISLYQARDLLLPRLMNGEIEV